MNIDFSPEKSLFSLPVVQWCAGVSALFAIVVTTAIAFSLRELPFDLTANGFNYFSDQFKVPAALLAIGFTLVGLCAANHRSEQTKKQIERTSIQISLTNNQINLTVEQNIFANHYKHLEEFEKYCTSIWERESDECNEMKLKFEKNSTLMEVYGVMRPLIDQKYLRGAYTYIYPNSKKGDFRLSENFIEEIDRKIINIAKKYNQMAKNSAKGDFHGVSNCIIEINDSVEEFASDYLIDSSHQYMSDNVFILNRSIYIPNQDFTFLTKRFIDYVTAIHTALSFDVSYKPSKIIIKAITIKISKLKSADISSNVLQVDWDDQNILRIMTTENNK